MTPEVQQAFDRFQKVMDASGFDLVDVLVVQLGFMERGQANIAASLTAHMRDQLEGMSTGEEVSYARLMSEAYRRTFCDPETAKKYGTDGMANDTAQVVSFLTFLAEHYGNTNADPAQVQLMLDADDTNAH